MIIAVSKRMLQPKLTKEWIVYLKTLKPVLWSWPGSRLWPGGTGEQRCGMFCDARVLKVTDWVMWGIFAYWPSWSVSVNKELKPLYISSRTIPLAVLCHWHCLEILTGTGRHRFSYFEHKYSSPSPLLALYHVSHSHTIQIIYLCLHSTWVQVIPVQMLITAVNILKILGSWRLRLRNLHQEMTLGGNFDTLTDEASLVSELFSEKSPITTCHSLPTIDLERKVTVCLITILLPWWGSQHALAKPVTNNSLTQHSRLIIHFIKDCK